MDDPLHLLEEITEKVRSGDIAGVAIATVHFDMSTGNNYFLGNATLAGLLGSVELLKYRMLCNSDHEVE